MHFEDPFVVYGTHQLNHEEIDAYAVAYLDWINALQQNAVGANLTS